MALAAESIAAQKEVRKKWGVNDEVEVFSKSRGEWFPAKIIEIYDDEDGEWLAVVVAETMIKEVQRFNADVRPKVLAAPKEEEESSDDEDSFDSGDESEESDDEESEDESASSDEDSDEDDEKTNHSHNKKRSKKRTKQSKKKKKKDKQLAKHCELIVIIVERAGSNVCNGKYTYSTSKNGFPVFENMANPAVTIWCDADEEQWIFSKNKKILYYAETQRELPPSSGWSHLKGILPVPGVRLEKLEQQAGKSDFFEDDPYKFSPFLMLHHPFRVDRKLGFDLEIIESHDKFIAIKTIISGSQAEDFQLRKGDILVSVGGEDLSKTKDLSAVTSALEETFSIVKAQNRGAVYDSATSKNASNAHATVELIFAREKKTFKVVMVQRGGTPEVNGKYAIAGEESNALCFVKNNNPQFKICRIYVSEDNSEDEAIWVLRKDNQDFYIVLASARDEIPPECGWEAVDPHGLWPAPGLTYYDVNIIPPPKPKITRIQPNPNAVQIQFDCVGVGERRPKVCPHMEVWYEVECKKLAKSMGGSLTPRRVTFAVGAKSVPVFGDTPSAVGLPAETRVIRCDSSPVVVNKLTNGEDYVFTVRTCNQISSSSSEPSPKVTPLMLPPKARIRDIKGYPGELFVTFTCPHAADPDVQAKFEVIVTPEIPHQKLYKMVDGRLIVPDDNLPVRLQKLKNGQTYQIIIACVNSVGVTYSEPESAYPSKAPPQPKITGVEPGSREILCHFECPGHDEPDTRAWFEIDIDPPPPTLITHDENAAGRTPGHDGGTPSAELSKSDMSHSSDASISHSSHLSVESSLIGGGLNMGRLARSATVGRRFRKKSRWQRKMHMDDEEDNSIPAFRRHPRYEKSPIRISPLNNGQEYVLRVRAVTLTGQKITEFTSAVTPKGPPPMPKVTKVLPKESSAVVSFECDDYAVEQHRAKFEVESKPSTVTLKHIHGSPVDFGGLRNGVNYSFSVRAVHKEWGKSGWSDQSTQITPLMKPPEPVSLQCVPFDGEITVFWVCEELNQPQYQGWYEVVSDPPTFTMVVNRQQARFRRLTNGQRYTFTVSAVNKVDRCLSAVSEPCLPQETIRKQAYLQEKKRIACIVRDEVLAKRREQKRLAAKEQISEIGKKREAMQHLEDEKRRKKIAKKMKKERKTKDAQSKRQKKKEKEREVRRLKMEEQRKKVLTNKRRISLLHRERINDIQSKFNTHKSNPNMISAMVYKSKAALAQQQKAFGTGAGEKKKKRKSRKVPSPAVEDEKDGSEGVIKDKALKPSAGKKRKSGGNSNVSSAANSGSKAPRVSTKAAKPRLDAKTSNNKKKRSSQKNAPASPTRKRGGGPNKLNSPPASPKKRKDGARRSTRGKSHIKPESALD